MIDPLFWLALSFLLVSVSLTAVLVALLPAVRELGRAARSVEKLCDTLSRELPPTLESIRLTSLEITELTDDMTDGVQNASRVAQQVDQSVNTVRHQAKRVHVGTRSLMVGVRAAWKNFTQPHNRDRRRLSSSGSPSPLNARITNQDTATGSPPHKPSRFAQRTASAVPEESPAPLPELPSGKTVEIDLTPSTAYPVANTETSESSDGSVPRPDPLE